MTGPATQLHIERIVIDGVPLSAAEARQLQHALQHELARLFDAGPGHDWRSAAIDRLAAPAVTLGAPVHPADMGRAIARSVHASLTGAP